MAKAREPKVFRSMDDLPLMLTPYDLMDFLGKGQRQTYELTLCVTAADDIGKVNLEVYDKASNGFKVRNLGSAKSVSFTWTIINTNIQ